MKKYKTLNQEGDEDWKKYMEGCKKSGYTQTNYSHGKFIKDIETDSWLVHKFCPSGMCNLFHHNEMCKFLINIGVSFTVNHWGVIGRNRHALLTVHLPRKDHYIKIYASGYGTGEVLELSKKFPPKLKFQLMREMATSITREDIKRYEHDKEKEKYAPILIQSKVLNDMLNNFATNVEDLNSIANLYSLLSNHTCYSAKDTKPMWREAYKQHKEEWNEMTKSIWYRRYRMYRYKYQQEIQKSKSK